MQSHFGRTTYSKNIYYTSVLLPFLIQWMLNRSDEGVEKTGQIYVQSVFQRIHGLPVENPIIYEKPSATFQDFIDTYYRFQNLKAFS